MPNNNYYKAQRPTLTYYQMHGGRAGAMEGKGIFGKINKFLKKTKLISTVGGLAGPLLSGVYPAAGKAITIGANVAKQAGYGVALPGGAKTVSAAQVRGLMAGQGRPLKGGGISLPGALKNVSAHQMKCLRAGLGRYLKSGGISLKGGPPSRNAKYMGKGYSGQGIKLAGMGRPGYKKKRVRRKKPVMMYRY